MPVTLLFTGYYRHRKMVAANRLTGGELAEVLWTRLLDYCNEYGTDGLIIDGVPDTVCPRQTKKRVDALVEVGLLDDVAGGWQMHDFHEWNRPAVELQARNRQVSEVRSKAGKAGAAKRWGNRLPAANGVAHD